MVLPCNKSGYDAHPYYREVTGSEAQDIANQYGRDDAIVDTGEYTIVDGHVYHYEPTEGVSYDPIYTRWANDPRVVGRK